MARTDEYQKILDELADGEMDELQVRIFHFLRRVYPAAMTRRDLIECIFGYRPAENADLNNSTHDRKIRTAIAGLFEQDYPIVSTSGGAGYRIDIDLESWGELVNELESKKKTLERKIGAAKRISTRIRKSGRNAIPTSVPPIHTSAPASAPKQRQLSFLSDGAS